MDKFIGAILRNGLGHLSVDAVNELYLAAQPEPVVHNDGPSPAVHRYLLDGMRIQAIKQYRDEVKTRTGTYATLVESRDAIEGFLARYNYPPKRAY